MQAAALNMFSPCITQHGLTRALASSLRLTAAVESNTLQTISLTSTPTLLRGTSPCSASSTTGQVRMHKTSASSMPKNSIDPKEAAKFAALSSHWWDPKGPFAPLLRMNPTRCKFIRDAVCAVKGLEYKDPEPFKGLRFLDVGCGGGILSESIARLGAQVHGIDVTHENVQAATSHAQLDPIVASRVRYQRIPLEELAQQLNPTANQPGQEHTSTAADSATNTSSTAGTSSTAATAAPGQLYDVVMASEVIEHVKRPDLFIKTLATVVAPGGTLIMSTVNRTPAAYAITILAAEYLTGIVPRGTHDWSKYLTPTELSIMAKQAGLEMVHAAGIDINPRNGTFVLTDDLKANYIAAFHKL